MKIPIYEEIKGMINCSLFQQWNIIMLLKRSHRDKVHIAKNLKTFHLIKRSEMLTTVIYHLFIWTAQYATTSLRYQGNLQPSMGISSLQYQGKRVTGMGRIDDGGGVSLEVWNRLW